MNEIKTIEQLQEMVNELSPAVLACMQAVLKTAQTDDERAQLRQMFVCAIALIDSFHAGVRAPEDNDSNN